jgi:renalase
MPVSVAIIGAGSSGLAAAHVLRDLGSPVTLFEKSHVVGGRAATRRREGFIYDYGANYIKQGDAASTTLITTRFSSPDLIDISKPVWIFDGAGHIQEGDPQQNAEAKWNYRYGLNTLATRMAQDLDVRLDIEITRLQANAGGWTLFTHSEQAVGTFDKVLIAIPATQAIELVKASQFSSDLGANIIFHLKSAHYNPLISVLLGYRPRPRVRPYYALVNTDRAHAISWLSWEHEKAPERAPHDAGLLMAQMGPHYSQEHWETADEEIYRDVALQIAALTDEQLPAPYFTDIQRWRYALPTQKADAEALNALTLPSGLALCGDSFVGGRVHLSLEHGMQVAQQLINGHV